VGNEEKTSAEETKKPRERKEDGDMVKEEKRSTEETQKVSDGKGRRRHGKRRHLSYISSNCL
jgi:hypothetical protein